MKATITEDSIITQAGHANKSPHDANERKVCRIRRHLKEGKYNLDERLDIAIDRILENVCK